MGVDHLSGNQAILREIQEMLREQKRASKATMQNGSIGRAGLRVYDGGWIRIEGGGLDVTGTELVSGLLRVTGTQQVDGRLEGTGVFDWSGPLFLRGNTGITGILQVTGPTTIVGTLNVAGATTLNNDLTVGTGRIVVGNMVLDKAGTYGGRITSGVGILLDTPSILSTGAVTATNISATGDLSALGDLSVVGSSTVSGTKSFRMPHPVKDEHWLQHGCTESPISGTEYTGRVTIGVDGSAVVELPDYFEALNKQRNRTVQVTAVGRPFMVGAEEVVDGKVTVYGEPGRDVFWLVKAERTGGDFAVESAIPAAPVNYD